MRLVGRFPFAAVALIACLSLACMTLAAVVHPTFGSVAAFLLIGIGAALFASAVTWYAVRPSPSLETDLARDPLVGLILSFGKLGREIHNHTAPDYKSEWARCHRVEVEAILRSDERPDVAARLRSYVYALETFDKAALGASAKTHHNFDSPWSVAKGHFLLLCLAVSGREADDRMEEAVVSYVSERGASEHQANPLRRLY